MDVRLFVESNRRIIAPPTQLDALVSQLINNQIIPSSTVSSCFPYLGQFFSYCRVDPTCTSAGSLQFYAVDEVLCWLDEDCVAIDGHHSLAESFSYSLPPFLFHFHLLLTDEGKTVDERRTDCGIRHGSVVRCFAAHSSNIHYVVEDSTTDHRPLFVPRTAVTR